MIIDDKIGKTVNCNEWKLHNHNHKIIGNNNKKKKYYNQTCITCLTSQLIGDFEWDFALCL